MVRLVTLDGKLVEATGLISGGGVPKKGAMQTTNSSNTGHMLQKD
jgi:chromosome segregation ATPase